MCLDSAYFDWKYCIKINLIKIVLYGYEYSQKVGHRKDKINNEIILIFNFFPHSFSVSLNVAEDWKFSVFGIFLGLFGYRALFMGPTNMKFNKF